MNENDILGDTMNEMMFYGGERSETYQVCLGDQNRTKIWQNKRGRRGATWSVDGGVR